MEIFKEVLEALKVEANSEEDFVQGDIHREVFPHQEIKTILLMIEDQMIASTSLHNLLNAVKTCHIN